MNRRGFLAGILASGFAPAIGHAGILMPVKKIEVMGDSIARVWNCGWSTPPEGDVIFEISNEAWNVILADGRPYNEATYRRLQAFRVPET